MPDKLSSKNQLIILVHGYFKDCTDMNFLKLGGSMFPIDELKTAGVDMASKEPIKATIAHFENRIYELESLWQSS